MLNESQHWKLWPRHLQVSCMSPHPLERKCGHLRIILSYKHIQASFASSFYPFLLDASPHFRVLLPSWSLHPLPLEEQKYSWLDITVYYRLTENLCLKFVHTKVFPQWGVCMVWELSVSVGPASNSTSLGRISLMFLQRPTSLTSGHVDQADLSLPSEFGCRHITRTWSIRVPHAYGHSDKSGKWHKAQAGRWESWALISLRTSDDRMSP